MKSRPSNVRKALAERFWGIFDNLAADMVKGVIGLLIAGVVFLYLFAAWLIPWVVVSLLGLAWLIDHTYQARRTKEQVRELENILARMTSLGLTYLNLMKPVAAVDIDRP